MKHKGSKKRQCSKKKDNIQERLVKGLRAFSEEEYSKARVSFASSLKSNPDNGKLLHMLSESLLREGDQEGAKNNLKLAYEKGKDVWTGRSLANIFSTSGNIEEAEKILKECLECNPSNQWAYLNLASFYRKQGKLDDSMEVLNRATTIAADSAIILGLVQVLLDYEPSPEVAGKFSKFLVMTPKNWLGNHLLTRCFMRQEQYDTSLDIQEKAIGLMRQEISLAPKYLYNCYNRLMSQLFVEKSMISFLAKDYDGLVASSLNVLRHNSKQWEILYFLGVGYLYQGLLDKGRIALLKYLSEDINNDETLDLHSPIRLSARLLVGQSYISQSSFQEAIQIYKEIVEEEPEIVEAYLNGGYSYFCIGDVESSKNMFKKLLEIKKDNLVALNNLGFLEMHQRNFSAAKEYFSKAIEVSPDYPLPYANLGFILTVEGNYEEAEKILIKVLNLKVPEEASLKMIYPYSKEENIKMGGPPIEENKAISSHIASLCNLGTSMARRGDYKSAHECFDRLIEVKEPYHFGYRGKSWIYFLENDMKSSLQYMRKAFEKNPENKVLQEEYEFIQSRAGKITETKKMASVLEGFFSSPAEQPSVKCDTDMNFVKDLKLEELESDEDGGIWDNLLVEKEHILSIEKNINQFLEEDIVELETLLSWKNASPLSEEDDKTDEGE